MLNIASTRKRPETAHISTHTGERAALASARTLFLTQMKWRMMHQAEIAYLLKSFGMWEKASPPAVCTMRKYSNVPFWR
jgi:hypothetical protein